MHNLVLSPIDPEKLISSISERVTANILKAVRDESFNESEKILTITQASELLNLTVPTLYSKVSKSEIPFMKRSKRLYFSKVELLEYLKQGRKKTTSEISDETPSYFKKRGGKTL